MYRHGWFVVAFEHEITEEITPVELGDLRLMLVRGENGRLQAYDANCPHRGAHLAYGGRKEKNCVVCPFHGYRIGLGAKRDGQLFQVAEYETLVVNGVVFVNLSDEYDNGFRGFITQLGETHHFVPAFHMPVKTTAAMVTENGFDNRHFPAVHGILNDPRFEVTTRETGQVRVESTFIVPGGRKPVPYEANTFSPGLIVVHLSGEPPYSVITGSQPLADGNCIINLTLAFDKTAYQGEPNEHFVKNLIEYSWDGLEDDRVMWENMIPIDPELLTAQDRAVLIFQEFCKKFEKQEAVLA